MNDSPTSSNASLSGAPVSNEGFTKERVLRGLWQLIKFGIVGVLNTAVDFAVLNLLVWLTGTTEGVGLAVINVVAFAVAVTNSYLWNKFWTFRRKDSDEVGQEISKFLVVSVIGALLNTGVVFGITTLMDPLFGLSDTLWVNVAKVLATIVVLAWNFVGYKFWAFRMAEQDKPVVS